MARRVNTRFVWIITIVIGCGVLGVMALKLIRHHGAAYYASLGDKQLAAGDLQQAAQDYGQAFYAGHPQNPEYMIKAGDVLWKETANDPDMLGQAVGTWQKVLEVDPRNEEALTRLLNTLVEEVQIGARAELLTTLADYARRLHDADPKNADAAAWMKIAPVQAYVAGVATDPVKLEKQLVDLQKVYTDDPTNTQAMMVMAQARLHLSQDASRRNDPDEADKQRQLALSTFDAALKKEPNNPDVLLHAAEIQVGVMRMMDLRVMTAQQSGQTGPDVEQAKAQGKTLRQQVTANTQHGQALLKPDADNYEDLALIGINLDMQLGDGAGAVKGCQELLKNMPDSLRARVLYARILKQSPQHWKEAIAMLSAPTSGKASQLGPKARLLKGEQMEILNELTAIRIDLCADEKDASKKAAELQEIQDGYTKLAAGIGHETPETLTLKGRILQLQGKTIDAIQALEKAETAYQAAGMGDRDVELSKALAWAYWRVGQTGQARRLLKQIVDDYPGYAPARVMLVELLLEENDAKSAEPHIKFLEQNLPGNPDVVEMRFASDIMQGQTDQAKAIYAKLPENTANEQAIKARDADKLSDWAEEQRLLEKIHAKYPDEMVSVGLLAQFYAQHGQGDKAAKLIDQAIATHPDAAPQLQLVRQQLLATSPEQKQALMQQSIEQSKTDPAIKELQLFSMAQQQGNADEAMKHLDKAEQIAPNNPHVLETRLNVLIAKKDWDGAQKYVDRLSKLNFDNTGGLFYQHQLALAKGDYEQAIDLANRAIAKLPQFGQGYIALAQALQGEGRYQEAINKYLDALDKQNNNLQAIQGLIGCYYALNRPQDAARYIAAGRQADPNNLVMREIEIEYSLKYGDGTLAITARQEALKSDPNNAGNAQNLGLAYLRAASYRLDQHDTAGAQPYVDKLRALIADGMQRWPQERGFYGLAGDLAIATKDFDYGQTWMTRMVSKPLWSNDPRTYDILANFYKRFNKMDQAETALRTALDKGGGADYRIELATFLASQRNEPDEALKLLEPMVETDQIREERVQILLAANRAMEAEPIVRDLLNRNPNSPVYQQQMLEIEGDEGKIDALVADTTAMLAKNPKDDNAMYYRGMAKMRKATPDLDGAMHDFQTVIDDDPTNVQARYLLSDIYRQRNDWDSAISQVQQALSAQPGNKAVRVKLIELESSAVPPRWSDVEKLISDAKADPVMQNDPTWSVEAGNMWRTRGDASQALAAFQNAMKLAPKDQGAFRAYIETLLWANQSDQVLNLTDSAARQADAPAWMHEDRAIAASRLNKSDLARSEILAALNAPGVVASSPAIITLVQASKASKQVDAVLAALGEKTATDGRWQMLAGYLHHEQQQDTQAADMMSRAATGTGLSPAERVEAARWAGSLYMSMQPPDFEKAITMTKLVLDANPNSIEALNNLACMLVDSVKPPRPDEALQYSQRAYDLMRKSGQIQPLIQDTQGWVLLNNGKVNDAVLLLRQVVDNKPFLDAYYHLAEAYLRSNQPLPAQQQLTLATQLLDDMKKNNQAYDPTLPGKIDKAKQDAKDMMKMQASAPR